MTIKQQRFADEYIISGNIYQSAIKAGYSEAYAKNAKEKMVEKGGKISAYITKRVKELEEKKIATATEVLIALTAVLRQELTEEQQEFNPVTGEIETLVKKPSIKDVINAGKEILKRYPTTMETEKLRLEIEKLKAQIGGSEQQDDRIASYIRLLKEGLADE